MRKYLYIIISKKTHFHIKKFFRGLPKKRLHKYMILKAFSNAVSQASYEGAKKCRVLISHCET